MGAHDAATPPPTSRARRAGTAATLACALVMGGCSFSGGVQGSGAASTTAPPGRPPSEAPTAPASVEPPAPPPSTPPTTTPPQGTAAPSPDAPGLDRCTTAVLDVSITDVSAAAGSAPARRDIVLRNVSQAGCTLRGYPGVAFVDGPDLAPVGRSAVRLENRETPTVTLSPGRSARAELRVRALETFETEVCQPAPAQGLVVYPPDGSVASVVSGTTRTCSTLDADVLSVGPVVAST